MIVNINELPDTEVLAESIAVHLPAGSILYLEGDLGVGKTTFVQYMLQALGYKGNVTSPTYTLVEPYELDKFTLYHFDLYRLNNPEELEAIGIRDYLTAESVCIFEWPEKGGPLVPPADLVINIAYDEKNSLPTARIIKLHPNTPAQVEVVQQATMDWQ